MKTKTNIEINTTPPKESLSTLEKLPNIYPHPVAMVFIMTLVVFLLGVALTSKGFEMLFNFWGQGLIGNFPIGMQFVLLLLLSYGLAITPIFQSLLRRLSGLPNSQKHAVIMLVTFSILLSLLNWGLGLIGGVFLAREIAKRFNSLEIDYDYPLLVTASIAGALVWETGMSGNAVLYITQGNHKLVEQIGAISLQQTTFSSLNIIVTLILLVLIPITLNMVKNNNTKKYEEKEIKEELLPSKEQKNEEKTIAVKLENSWTLSLVFGAIGVMYVVQQLVLGNSLNMSIYLFMLIALGVILRKQPMTYQRDILKGVEASWVFYIPIVFYGAIQGVFVLSGMAEQFASSLSSISTSITFPIITFFSSAVLNLFVPHAGSQWLIQGSSIIEAANDLGVSSVKAILAFSYGAGWTKLLLISIFVPIFGIKGLKISDLKKYLGAMIIVSMLVYVIVLTIVAI